MGGGQCLGDGGHAHGIGAQDAGGPDLGGSLKLGAGEEHVHALVDPDAGAGGAVQGQLPQLRGVHPGDVEEAGAELLHVGAPEGAAAVELDVVGDDHHIAGAVAGVDGAGGVGEDGGLDAQQLEYPNGDDQLFEVIALIGVEPAGHAHHLAAADGAEDELAGVGGHGGHQEIGDVLVIHHHGVFNLLGKGAQAGAQDDGDLRGEVHFLLQKVGALLKICIRIGHDSNTSCCFGSAAPSRGRMAAATSNIVSQLVLSVNPTKSNRNKQQTKQNQQAERDWTRAGRCDTVRDANKRTGERPWN